MALIGGKSEKNVQELLLDASKYKKELADVAKKIRQQQKHEKDLSTVRKALDKQTGELSQKNKKLGKSLPTKGFGNFNDVLGNMSKNMVGMAAKIGPIVAGLAGVGKLMKDLIKNGLTWNDWIGNNTVALDGQSKSVDNLIDKMQLMNSRMQLTQGGFKLTETQMQSLSKAAIVLARRTGGDATQALKRLTKALISGAPTTALRRLGMNIQLTGTQTEKFAEAVSLIEENFSGMTIKASNMNEELAQAENAWKNFTGLLGSALVSTLKPGLDAMTSLIGSVEDLISRWLDLGKYAVDVPSEVRRKIKYEEDKAAAEDRQKSVRAEINRLEKRVEEIQGIGGISQQRERDRRVDALNKRIGELLKIETQLRQRQADLMNQIAGTDKDIEEIKNSRDRLKQARKAQAGRMLFGNVGQSEFTFNTADEANAASRTSITSGVIKARKTATITRPTESFGIGNADEIEGYVKKLRDIEARLSKPISVGTEVAGDSWAAQQREKINAYFAEADAIDRVIERQRLMNETVTQFIPNAQQLTGTFLDITDAAIQAAFAGQNVFQVIMNAILGLVKQSAFAVASKATGEAIYASSMAGVMSAEAAGLWASALNPFGGQAFIPAASAKTAAAASMSAAATQMGAVAAIAGGVGIAASVGQGAMNASIGRGGGGGGRSGRSPSSNRTSTGSEGNASGETYVNNVYSEGPYKKAQPRGSVLQMAPMSEQPYANRPWQITEPRGENTVVRIEKVVLELQDADPATMALNERKIAVKTIDMIKKHGNFRLA